MIKKPTVPVANLVNGPPMTGTPRKPGPPQPGEIGYTGFVGATPWWQNPDPNATLTPFGKSELLKAKSGQLISGISGANSGLPGAAGIDDSSWFASHPPPPPPPGGGKIFSNVANYQGPGPTSGPPSPNINTTQPTQPGTTRVPYASPFNPVSGALIPGGKTSLPPGFVMPGFQGTPSGSPTSVTGGNPLGGGTMPPGTNTTNNNPYDPTNILRTLYGSTTTPPSLTPGPVSGYNPAFGGVPTVPDPTATQGKVVGGNLQNLDDIKKLAQMVNDFMAKQAANQYKTNLPLYDKLNTQGSQNILNDLQGKVPQDVMDLIATQAAERGIAIGSPGSPNANASMLRALGLTSLDLMGKGQDELTKAIGRTPTSKPFDPSTMFVTPEQQQLAQLLANIYGSAPNPGAAADKNLASLIAGLNRGKGDTTPGSYNPSGSNDFLKDIIQKYAPGPIGTPSSSTTPAPRGNWMQQEDGTWVNLDTGEVSWTGPGEPSEGPNYYPDIYSGNTTDNTTDQSQGGDDFWDYFAEDFGG